jgi:pimeloyl-ACP methyl ester carboxylesterase
MSEAKMATEKKSKGAGCLRWLGRVALGFLILLLVAGGAGAIYQAVGSARDAKAYKPVDQIVDVNGIQMRLDCRGSGSPTVVLEAGAQSSSLFWVRIQDDVAKFTRVCSYDRAGYGWSEPVHETMLPPQVAGMLHDLLEKAGEKPPYLMVGHSFGGVYIRTFTAQYPDEVVGMVLVDSSHENQSQQVPPEIAESPEFIQIQEAGATAYRIFKIAEPVGLLRMLKLMDPAVASYQLPDKEKELALAEVYRTGYMGAWLRETEMTSAYSSQPGKLGAIPLIVLSREYDVEDVEKAFEAYPPASQALLTMEVKQRIVDTYNGNQNELAALSTRGKRIVVPDTGHYIQLDKPQVVIDAIREVFGQVAK